MLGRLLTNLTMLHHHLPTRMLPRNPRVPQKERRAVMKNTTVRFRSEHRVPTLPSRMQNWGLLSAGMSIVTPPSEPGAPCEEEAWTWGSAWSALSGAVKQVCPL